MKKTQIEAGVIYGLLVVTMLLLGLMYYRLDDSINETTGQILDEKSDLVHEKLNSFFDPVVQNVNAEWLDGKQNKLDTLPVPDFVNHFYGTLESSSSISGAFIGDEFGNNTWCAKIREKVFHSSRHYLGNKTDRKTDIGVYSVINERCTVDSTGTKDSDYDPRIRPWYQIAENSESVVWTEPYFFNQEEKTTGISVSRKYSESPMRIVGYDVSCDDLSLMTTKVNVSEHGLAMVISDSGKVVGLPNIQNITEPDSILKYALADISEFKDERIQQAYKSWEQNKSEEAFRYKVDGDNYWARFSTFKLGNIYFEVLVLAPEEELAGAIIRTKKLLLYGLIFILFVSIVLVQAYRQKRKSNQTLSLQKQEIETQKLIVEHKNQEITDSMVYAKRIQQAILPPAKLIKEHLPESFVLYKPKDIVAGDFYWLESIKEGDTVLFAAADCTGHGVPGAMVSVICNGGLNRSVREFGLQSPGDILDKTREIVIQEFEKSEEDVKDGMDIALCSLSNMTLEYAGANNPLWLIRKGEVLETKANKQPIGNFDKPLPYTTHSVELQKGDTIYIFSDGYPDQFGGEKGKKFKAKAFRELLLSIQDKSMEEQKTLIDEVFETWRGELEQIDDVCVIGVRI
ncbi:MAG: serine phosphatase RsbU (regulator of sigma subunit) [Arenicella sp.]|jgi:serine phosphatase RsbU (regulator of sigma subunit)